MEVDVESAENGGQNKTFNSIDRCSKKQPTMAARQIPVYRHLISAYITPSAKSWIGHCPKHVIKASESENYSSPEFQLVCDRHPFGHFRRRGIRGGESGGRPVRSGAVDDECILPAPGGRR